VVKHPFSERRLLNHLIRPPHERLGDRQPERLGGLEIDDQLELGGLLDGEIGGLGALRSWAVGPST